MNNNFDGISQIVKEGALRWLHGIDFREYSKTYGVADREYWAWKTKDFANGTLQAGISGFLDSQKLLDFTDLEIRSITSAVIEGCNKIQRKDGSFEEAYPYESSYAVTGLVLFNLMYSYCKYQSLFTKKAIERLELVCEKSYRFLIDTDESHGIISNHICTTVLAIDMYEQNFKSKDSSSEKIKHFLSLQDLKEGWFPEYGMADPGYQTLLNHYMSAYLSIFTNNDINQSLKSSLRFVNNFKFPNGVFAGEIGARGTNIVYPSGLRDWDWFAHKHSKEYFCVSPVNVDVGNFVPVYNSWAFELSRDQAHIDYDLINGLQEYKNAKLLIIENPKFKIIVNLKNGVVINKYKENSSWLDGSVSDVIDKNVHSQLGEITGYNITNEMIEYRLQGRKINQILNQPSKSIIIRIVALLIFYMPWMKRAWKALLAKVVMGQNKKLYPLDAKIQINLKSGQVNVLHKNNVYLKKGFSQHMASANTFSREAL